MEQEPNYGRHQEPGDGMNAGADAEETRSIPRSPGGEMGPRDERTWSMLSHLSVLLAFVGLMPLGSLIIWLIYKDRSPRVGFHALQSLWYQVAWVVLLVAGWSITFVLSFILIGLLLIPVMLLASVVPVIHGCYAAYKVNQGVDYRYPFIADKIDGGQRMV